MKTIRRRMKDDERAAILAYLKDHSIKATAKKFDRAHSTVRDIRNKNRPGGATVIKGKQSKCEYVPTLDEIEAHCRIFRERSRPESRPRDYYLPVYGSVCGEKKSRIFVRVG